MIKALINAVILTMVTVSIFNMFFAIKYTLEYMMLPRIVPLIWFLVALPTPYFATILVAPLLN
jgi:hypothetical protein